jgi:hypothetical protein
MVLLNSGINTVANKLPSAVQTPARDSLQTLATIAII